METHSVQGHLEAEGRSTILITIISAVNRSILKECRMVHFGQWKMSVRVFVGEFSWNYTE